MSADTAPLAKVDSAVEGLGTSPPKEKGHRRASSSVAGVYNINDLGKLYYAAQASDDPQALNRHHK
jgi:hypothetical protein